MTLLNTIQEKPLWYVPITIFQKLSGFRTKKTLFLSLVHKPKPPRNQISCAQQCRWEKTLQKEMLKAKEYGQHLTFCKLLFGITETVSLLPEASPFINEPVFPWKLSQTGPQSDNTLHEPVLSCSSILVSYKLYLEQQLVEVGNRYIHPQELFEKSLLPPDGTVENGSVKTEVYSEQSEKYSAALCPDIVSWSQISQV